MQSFLEFSEEKKITVKTKMGGEIPATIKVTGKDYHIVKTDSGKTYKVDHQGNSLEEEIELSEDQLDELSKDKLSWYLKKASSHMDKKGENMIKRDKKFNPGANKLTRQIGGLSQRQDSIATASKKYLAKEEIDLSEEQLDELKKSTLASYVNKASTSAKIASDKIRRFPNYQGNDDDATRDLIHKRLVGVSKASEKLTKEEIDLSEDQGVAEGLVKSIKRGLQGWGKDGVTPGSIKNRARELSNQELDDQLAGHETLRKSTASTPKSQNPHSPASLQKRVLDREKKKREQGVSEETDKDLPFTPDKKKTKPSTPGKYGSAYSTVRNLARKALEKQKQVKEKITVDEELEEAFINGREYASQGVIHPTHAKVHKVGNQTDFYAHGTGDKLSGKVIKNTGKEVHFQADKIHGGKVHKFNVSSHLPKPVNEEIEEGYRGNSEADKPFFAAQDHKKAAEKARKSGDHFSYHKHMSAHHDAMEQWNSNKGRTHVANQHAMKADEHEDYAQQARKGSK